METIYSPLSDGDCVLDSMVRAVLIVYGGDNDSPAVRVIENGVLSSFSRVKKYQPANDNHWKSVIEVFRNCSSPPSTTSRRRAAGGEHGTTPSMVLLATQTLSNKLTQDKKHE
jgi:hypothetical protein